MRKILIIDDEKNIRSTLSTYLGSEGYLVETALNGEEGLKKYRESEFDLVLLDMKMPGKDGVEILREIKAESTKDAVVVMITGYGSVGSAVEALKLGAVDYLQKPFTPEEILQVVQNVLQRRDLNKAERELGTMDEFLAFAKNLIHAGKFTDARRVLNQAITLEEKRAEALNLLGAICEMQKEQGEAMKYYRAALALDPTYSPARHNLERASEYNYSLHGIELEEEEK